MLTKVYYVGHTLTVPASIRGQFEEVVWDFLWRGSKPLVKRMVCISSPSQGGLGMPHLPSRLAAVHLQTVRCLFDSNNHAGWKSLATAEIGSEWAVQTRISSFHCGKLEAARTELGETFPVL